MYFKISWDEDFADLMHHLWGKYGRKLFTIDGIGDQLDLDKFARTFFSNNKTMADISVDANANVASKSVVEWNFEFPKPLQRYNSYYLLWKTLRDTVGLQRANDIIEAQLCGDIYINDFSDIGRPYCYNFSTYDIALGGLTMSNRLKISPPKSMATFIRQVEQFIVYAANSTLGATGLADFLIVLSLFYKKASLNTRFIARGVLYKDGNVEVADLDRYTRELLTSFIYTVNWEFRGNQSPFTNISVYDKEFLKKLCSDYMLDDNKADADVVMLLQRMFLEIMNEELSRTPLTFPVVTACFNTDEENNIVDKDFCKQIAKANEKWGFINIYYGKTSTLSSCCRLRSDTDNPYFNSFGSGSTKIGSVGVVTLNLARLQGAYKEQLKDLVTMAAEINNAKRVIIQDRIDRGALPLYSLGHMSLSSQYSTVGFTGLAEAVKNLTGDDIVNNVEYAKELLEIINNINSQLEEKYKAPHNMEQTPAESSAVKLAKKDVYLKRADDVKLYSNQFVPLNSRVCPFTRLRIQGELDKYCTGGAICHINIEGKISGESIIELMEYAAKQGVVYWAINYALHDCKNGHLWRGYGVCPTCGEPIQSTYTRVVGFLTKVENWNETRRKEDFPHRQWAVYS